MILIQYTKNPFHIKYPPNIKNETPEILNNNSVGKYFPTTSPKKTAKKLANESAKADPKNTDNLFSEVLEIPNVAN